MDERKTDTWLVACRRTKVKETKTETTLGTRRRTSCVRQSYRGKRAVVKSSRPLAPRHWA